MNSKKAKAIRRMAELEIAIYEENSGKKVPETMRKKFYKDLKNKLKKNIVNQSPIKDE